MANIQSTPLANIYKSLYTPPPTANTRIIIITVPASSSLFHCLLSAQSNMSKGEVRRVVLLLRTPIMLASLISDLLCKASRLSTGLISCNDALCALTANTLLRNTDRLLLSTIILYGNTMVPWWLR